MVYDKKYCTFVYILLNCSQYDYHSLCRCHCRLQRRFCRIRLRGWRISVHGSTRVYVKPTMKRKNFVSNCLNVNLWSLHRTLVHRYWTVFSNDSQRTRCARVLMPYFSTMCFLCSRPPGTTVPGGLMFHPMFFPFFQRQISVVPRPIAAKLCNMIGNWLNFRL